MKKLLLLIIMILAVGNAGWAASDPTDNCFGPDECSFKLDEKTFKSSVVKRINAGLKARGKTDEFITDKHIEIIKIWPFSEGDFKLIAVKFRLAPAKKTQHGGISFLVVDSSGRYDVRALTDLTNGDDLRYDALAVIRHEDLPADFGYKILNGTGHSHVVIVSDPMCYHCKSAFRYMLANTRDVETLEMVHYFRRGDFDSETATRIIFYAIAHDITPVEVIKFAYTELSPPKTKGTNEELIKMIQVAILDQFYKKFPKLKESLGSDTDQALKTLKKETEDAAVAVEKKVMPLGMAGTPVVYIDGMRVDGFKPDIYNRAFSEKNENKTATEVEGG